MTCGKQGESLSLGGDILGGSWVLLGPGRANMPIQECQLELGEGETSVTGAVLGKAMAHSLLKESCKSLCQASKILLLPFLKVKLSDVSL